MSICPSCLSIYLIVMGVERSWQKMAVQPLERFSIKIVSSKIFISPYVYLFVCLSVYHVYLSIYLTVMDVDRSWLRMAVQPLVRFSLKIVLSEKSINLSIFIYPINYISIYLAIHLSNQLSIYLSSYPFIQSTIYLFI